MAVSLKNKRRIMVEGKKYVWSVGIDYDSPYFLCNIAACDKSIILSIPLKTNVCYIINKGPYFQDKEIGGIWKRYEIPFAIPDTITPSIISQIIHWVTEGRDAKLIEYDGYDVPL